MIEQAPVGLAHVACLGAYPAQVAAVAAIVPDKALGLQFADHLIGLRPLIISGTVYLTYLVGPAVPAIATIGTVEPYLKDVAVVRQQFAQLVAKVGHILRSSIVLMVSVPRREVDGKLQPLLTAGISQLAYYVALTLLPQRILNRILRIF